MLSSVPSAVARESPIPTSYRWNKSRKKPLKAWEIGATEVCIPRRLASCPASIFYRDIPPFREAGQVPACTSRFLSMEMVYGVELTGMPLEDYLCNVAVDNGLDTLPRTAAEILDDQVRQILSRNKLFEPNNGSKSSGPLIAAVFAALRPLMYGTVETPSTGEPASTLARNSERKPEGFTEVRSTSASFIKTRCSSIKGLAAQWANLWQNISKISTRLARLCWPGSINNNSVSWVKLNRQLLQLWLHAGEMICGTLMEEIFREKQARLPIQTLPRKLECC